MIRFVLGILLVLGAVGTLDIDPNASVLFQSILAAFGVFLMYEGAKAMQNE